MISFVQNLGGGERSVTCVGKVDSIVDLLEQQFNRGVGVPRRAHFLFVLGKGVRINLALTVEKMCKNIMNGNLGQSGVFVVKGSQIDGINGVGDLFFQRNLKMSVLVPLA